MKQLSTKEKLLKHSIPEPNTGCWLWTGCCAKGKFNYSKIRIKNKCLLAHRVSYEEFIGPIKNNLFVLHKCDTPSCINPNHLFVGTASDNMQDMVNKNRHPVFYKKTECIRGHAFSKENTRLQKIPGKTILKKVCRKCQNILHKQYYKEGRYE